VTARIRQDAKARRELWTRIRAWRLLPSSTPDVQSHRCLRGRRILIFPSCSNKQNSPRNGSHLFSRRELSLPTTDACSDAARYYAVAS